MKSILDFSIDSDPLLSYLVGNKLEVNLTTQALFLWRIDKTDFVLVDYLDLGLSDVYASRTSA